MSKISKKKKEETSILNLPQDMVNIMVENLSIESVLSLCSSNKQFNQWICSKDTFWKKRLKQDFDIIPVFSYEKIYKEEYTNKTMIPVLKELFVDYVPGFNKMTKNDQNNVYSEFLSDFKKEFDTDIDTYVYDISNELYMKDLIKLSVEEQVKKVSYYFDFDLDSIVSILTPIVNFIKKYKSKDFKDTSKDFFVGYDQDFMKIAGKVYITLFVYLGMRMYKSKKKL